MLPSHVLHGVSPIQLMTTFYPSISLMTNLQSRVFGYPIFVHVHGPHWGKLDPRAIKCVFIGYASNKKGYKCYHPCCNLPFGGRATRDSRDACSMKGIRAELPPTFI